MENESNAAAPVIRIAKGALVRFTTVGRGAAKMTRDGRLLDDVVVGAVHRPGIEARDGDKVRVFRPYPQHVTAL